MRSSSFPAAVGICAALATSALAGGSTKVQITLSGVDVPGASGKARFEDRGGEQRFRVEVEDAAALAGHEVIVLVDGMESGRMTLNGFGDATLALNSALGQSVPAIHAGSTVAVVTADGLVVVSGAF